MRKILLLGLLLLLALPSSLAAKSKKESSNRSYSHIIILKDGREYRGKLIEITDNRVTFEINGKEESFDKPLVQRVQFSKERMYNDLTNIKNVKSGDLKTVWQLSQRWGTSHIDKVILFNKIVYDIDNEENLKITHTYAIKVLDEDGLYLSNQSYHYLSRDEKLKLNYALTIQTDGSVIPLDEQAIKDEPLNSAYKLYDNEHRLKMGFKEVKVGSVIVYQIEKEIKKGAALGRFYDNIYLVSSYPIEQLIVEANYPESINFNAHIYEGALAESMVYKKPKVKIKSKDGMNNYNLTLKGVANYSTGEGYTRGSDFIYPKVVISAGKGWQVLSTYYYDNHFSHPISAEVRAFAQKIVGNESDGRRQTELLYEYLSRKVSLADISFFDNSYYPSADADGLIRENELNMLDKSYLFTILCRALDIDADLLFFRSNGLKPVIDEVPTVAQLNQIMVRINGEKPFYLYLGNNNYRAGQLYHTANNVTALNVSKREQELEKLSDVETMQQKNSLNYQLTLLDDNSILVESDVLLEGFRESGWRDIRFLGSTKMDKVQRESVISTYGNNADLLEYTYKNDLSDFSSPIHLTRRVKLNQALFSHDGDLKLFKLPGLSVPEYSIYDDRKYDFNRGVPTDLSYSYKIILPANHKVSYLPESEEFGDGDYYNFSYKASEEDGVLTIEIRYSSKEQIIPVKKCKRFKSWYRSVGKKLNQWIIIEEIK